LKNNKNLSFFYLLKYKNQPPKPYFKDSLKVLELFIGMSKILRSLRIKHDKKGLKKDSKDGPRVQNLLFNERYDAA
jgi:hypothetical protein